MESKIAHPTLTRDDREIKFNKLMDDSTMLRREDIIWILNYIKQKAADEDPALLSLHQPRLLRNFRCYAEAATLLLSSRNAGIQESGHIHKLLKEASYGLIES